MVGLAAALRRNLAADHPGCASRRQAMARGIPTLVRCVQSSAAAAVQDEALWTLSLLASDDAERCEAIVAAGGAAACVGALATPLSDDCYDSAQLLVCELARHGQSEAVVAADAAGAAVDAANEMLERCDNEAAFEALHHLAAARLQLGPPRFCAGPGCGATEGRLNRCHRCLMVRWCSEACCNAHWQEQTARCKQVREMRSAVESFRRMQARAAAASRAPPRVCAAPGGGGTAGLHRCTACRSRSVRYCGEACVRAHWREHRRECKRVCAERAAASSGVEAGRPQP